MGGVGGGVGGGGVGGAGVRPGGLRCGGGGRFFSFLTAGGGFIQKE